jgi:hypothetical protein
MPTSEYGTGICKFIPLNSSGILQTFQGCIMKMFSLHTIYVLFVDACR